MGGFGVAAVYESSVKGPSVLFRCDMDALPIREPEGTPHRSEVPGVSHKCGHDGHMAILAGLSAELSESPPRRGSVILLFQPSEETGQGAARVLEDESFRDLGPDMAFALHNLPGYSMGSLVIRNGVFASSSRGMKVELLGSSSHASEPHLGRSPASALAQIIEACAALPQSFIAMDHGAKATVIHARLGEEAFGTSPGEGVVMATLRAHRPEDMERLASEAAALASSIAEAWGLGCSISWTQEFPSTVNDPGAVKIAEDAAEDLGMQITRPVSPFPWSEDFGHFTGAFPGALMGLGAGTDSPALHSPDYDFPDDLIPVGVDLFKGIAHRILG